MFFESLFLGGISNTECLGETDHLDLLFPSPIRGNTHLLITRGGDRYRERGREREREREREGLSRVII